jgi:hypothetical protein
MVELPVIMVIIHPANINLQVNMRREMHIERFLLCTRFWKKGFWFNP